MSQTDLSATFQVINKHVVLSELDPASVIGEVDVTCYLDTAAICGGKNFGGPGRFDAWLLVTNDNKDKVFALELNRADGFERFERPFPEGLHLLGAYSRLSWFEDEEGRGTVPPSPADCFAVAGAVDGVTTFHLRVNHDAAEPANLTLEEICRSGKTAKAATRLVVILDTSAIRRIDGLLAITSVGVEVTHTLSDSNPESKTTVALLDPAYSVFCIELEPLKGGTKVLATVSMTLQTDAGEATVATNSAKLLWTTPK
jgi:hypothetical protein